MVKTIWTPDTFFPNEKKSFFHEATSHNSFLRIDNHGNVLRSIRLTVTANCPMSLHTVGFFYLMEMQFDKKFENIFF